MKLQLFLTVAVINFCISLAANNDVQRKTDSLINVLRSDALPASVELSARFELKMLSTKNPMAYFRNMKRAESKAFYLRIFQLAEAADDTYAVCRSAHWIAGEYVQDALYDSARYYNEISLDCARRLGNLERQCASLFNFWDMYMREGRYVSAIESNMQFEKLARQLPKNEKEYAENFAITLINYAESHCKIGNIVRARRYIEEHAAFLRDRRFVPNDETTIRLPYIKGMILRAEGKIDEAIAQEMKALEILRISKYPVYECLVLESLARMKLQIGDHANAMRFAQSADSLANSVADRYLQRISNLIISEIYNRDDRYQESLTAALRAWQIDSVAVDTGPDISFLIACNNLYFRNIETAEHFFRIHAAFIQQHETELHRMDVIHETAEKQTIISLLEKEKMLNFITGLFAILLLVAILLLIFYQRQKISAIEKDRQIAVDLAALQSEKEIRTRIAQYLHDRIGNLLTAVKFNMRQPATLDVAATTIDQAIQELRSTSHVLDYEHALHEGLGPAVENLCLPVLCSTFQMFGDSHRYDPDLECAVYLTANELINNAVKHSGASSIKVYLALARDNIMLSVEDNGTGFNPHPATEGAGLKNIRKRVNSFGGSMEVNSEPGIGTTVLVSFEMQTTS
jgi:signal transduction histidine kinase